MYIQPSKHFSENMRYNADYLLRIYPNTKFIIAGGKHIAIVNPPCNVDASHMLVMGEYRFVPLWKQSMDCCMGKMPKSRELSRHAIHYMDIAEEQVYRYTYYVYECR